MPVDCLAAMCWHYWRQEICIYFRQYAAHTLYFRAPPCPLTFKTGEARAPVGYMAPAPMVSARQQCLWKLPAKKSTANKRKEYNIESTFSGLITSVSLTIRVYLHLFSCVIVASQICEFREILRKFKLTDQGHPRSSILVPIESTYATSY